MKPLEEFKGNIKVLFTDIDDTLTREGKLPADSYSMLWDLQSRGIQVVPVTGRPAGWCEMIARMWPVAGVIGENGAFYFRYHQQKMERHFLYDNQTRLKNQKKLNHLKDKVFQEVPEAGLASDQFTRLFDVAIDFCEDILPLLDREVEKIVQIFEEGGATAKVSSIHVNAWFGDYDKKSMCETFYKNVYGKELSTSLDEVAFVGDSPNDEPLFGFFKNSVGVANILKFADRLKHPPQFVASHASASGFVEFGKKLLSIV